MFAHSTGPEAVHVPGVAASVATSEPRSVAVAVWVAKSAVSAEVSVTV